MGKSIHHTSSPRYLHFNNGEFMFGVVSRKQPLVAWLYSSGL
jgi:hypothetical protein